MPLIISTLLKPTGGVSAGVLLGQVVMLRVPGSPDSVDGTHFGLLSHAIRLVKRSVEQTITDKPFLEYIFGEGTVETEIVLPPLTEIPFLPNRDSRDTLYLRVA